MSEGRQLGSYGEELGKMEEILRKIEKINEKDIYDRRKDDAKKLDDCLLYHACFDTAAICGVHQFIF
jgi:hypothetical protein